MKLIQVSKNVGKLATVMNLLLAFVLISWILFLVSFLTDARRMMNGFLLMLSVALSFLFFYGLPSLFWTFLVFFLFGSMAAFTLIQTSSKLLRREGTKLSNLLSLVAGIALIIAMIAAFVFVYMVHEPALFLLNAIAAFYGLWFLFYFFSTLLYFLNVPPKEIDFIIVLGSGLDGRKITPLLNSRLQRALKEYKKQKTNTGKEATFIVSGGKGDDESISEGEAMAKHLRKLRIPSHHIVIENAAKNTKENIQLSKQIMDARTDAYTCVFVTSRYHLFRASIYTRKAGLHADGIGAATAFYYVPNAYIREFIAILFMYKGTHLLLVPFMLLCWMLFYAS